MKKLLFLLPLLLLTNLLFSQEISGPAPILELDINGTWVNIDEGDVVTVGCSAESARVKANWVSDIGGTGEYRVESIPFKPKAYLRDGDFDGNPDPPLTGQFFAGLPDDVWTPAISLSTGGVDLDFCYFGNARNEFVISTNGAVSFHTAYAGTGSSWAIHGMGRISPNANCGDYADSILQFHDTNPATTTDNDQYAFWDIRGDIGSRYFIMGTHRMPMFSCNGDNGLATHQMLFFETTNIIEFHIENKPLCEGWAQGRMAMGIQNEALDLGYAAAGRDNGDQYQIIERDVLGNPLPPFNTDGSFPNYAPEAWRFIPIETGYEPTFAWYADYDHTAETGILVGTDPILTVEISDIPTPANFRIYTAVVTYTNSCDGTITNFPQDVRFELIDGAVMNIVGKDTDDTGASFEDIDTSSDNLLLLCTGNNFTLKPEFTNYDSADGLPFRVDWQIEEFGQPDITHSDVAADYEELIVGAVPGTYRYICTVSHGLCSYSKIVNVRVLDGVSFDYPQNTYCANETPNPIPTPGNLFPAAINDPDPRFYFTVNNEGVWEDSQPIDADHATIFSLDGELDLDASMTAAIAGGTIEADGSADFTVTYHALCDDNTGTFDIKIKNGPNVLTPNIGNTLISKCETNSTLHTSTFDITAIENYIVNGISGLTISWAADSAVPLPDLSGPIVTTPVEVTITDPTAPACPVVINFILKVDTKPIGTDPNTSACSNAVLDIQLAGTIPAFFTGATFEWSAITHADVEGETTADQTSSSITDTLINTTLIVQTVVYNVIPTTLDGCEGDSFTVSVAVSPQPVGSTGSVITCGGGNIVGTNLHSHTTLSGVGAGNSYTWVFVDNLNVTGETNGSTVIMNQGLTNLSAVNQDVTYTVTPTSAAGCVGDTFEVVFSVGASPTGTDPNIVTCSDVALDINLDTAATLSGNTYSWEVTSNTGGLTGTTAGTSSAGTITDTITNISLSPETVVYTVTPTSVNLCPGTPFTVTVTVNPEPVGTDATSTVCSKDVLSLSLDSFMNISGNSFTWSAANNVNVGGETTTSQTSGTIGDTLTNTTLNPETVVYTVTPTGSAPNSCLGNDFTVSVTVNPEPVGTDTPVPACSDELKSIDLESITTLSGTGNSYSWVVTPNANVTGEVDGTGNMLTQTITNTSGTDQDVIYTVTPTSTDSCEGNTFVVTFNIGTEPVGTDPNLAAICSGEVLSIDLDHSDVTTLTGNTFEWEVTSNTGGLTGITAGTSSSGTITDTLVNITSTPHDVVYSVTPSSANGCEGNLFTITVTINPEPIAPATINETICSDMALNLDIDSYTTNSLVGNTYTWTVSTNTDVTITTGAASTTHITDIIKNESGSQQTVTYTVTPTSSAPNNCEGTPFNIVVVVDDQPVGVNQTPEICSGDSVGIDLNAISIISKPGTTFDWNVTDDTGGLATVISGTSNLIDEILINLTLVAQTVTYTITPTNGCTGDDFTVEVTVNPEPFGTATTVDACSDVTTAIDLDLLTTLSDIGTGNTYSWRADANPNVTGETISDTTSSVIAETLTNVSTSMQTVIYVVTPTSGSGCEGAKFIVRVEVGQKPVEVSPAPVLPPYCSDELTGDGINLNIDLDAFTTLGGNSYSWIAVDNTDVNVTGESLTAVSSSTINDEIVNTSSTVQKITYKIIPTASQDCVGDEFIIVVDVNPAPVAASDIEESACSHIPFTLDLNSYITNLTTGDNTFTWSVEDNPNVTGEEILIPSITEITQTITNTSTTTQEVIYKVTPTSASPNFCNGEEFEIRVSIGVEPQGDDEAVFTCSDIALDLDLNTFIDNLSSDDYSFSWYAEPNSFVIGEEGTDSTALSSALNITDTLTNTSGALQYVVYHITPTSVAPYSCVGDEFTITVEVRFEPVGTAPINPEIICHDEALSLSLDAYTTLTDNTYKWHAIANDNVSGETTEETDATTITDSIINTTGEDQIVEYVITPISLNGCEGDEFTVLVLVNPRPDFELKAQYFICPEIGMLEIGEEENSDNYEYFWYEANDMSTIIGYEKMETVDVSDLENSEGNYVLIVEDKDTGCRFSQFTSVSMAVQMAIAEVHISDFNRPDNSITIDITGGSGAYEYTLHYADSSNSITQESPIFDNLLAGAYTIEVTDTTDCSVAVMSTDLYVLDYPRFFTPNGDVDNDTWQITGANFIPNSEIFIFDRFGKVLAQIDPTEAIGWDGTYNGELLPASDYWFRASYIDPNTGSPKTITGHFSIVGN